MHIRSTNILSTSSELWMNMKWNLVLWWMAQYKHHSRVVTVKRVNSMAHLLTIAHCHDHITVILQAVYELPKFSKCNSKYYYWPIKGLYRLIWKSPPRKDRAGSPALWGKSWGQNSCSSRSFSRPSSNSFFRGIWWFASSIFRYCVNCDWYLLDLISMNIIYHTILFGG